MLKIFDLKVRLSLPFGRSFFAKNIKCCTLPYRSLQGPVNKPYGEALSAESPGGSLLADSSRAPIVFIAARQSFLKGFPNGLFSLHD